MKLFNYENRFFQFMGRIVDLVLLNLLTLLLCLPVITAGAGPMTKIDLGIVKYNFEAASGHKIAR